MLSSKSSFPQYKGHRALSTTVLFATVFAASSSIAEAVTNCKAMTELGGPAYTLDSSTKLSVKGFDASISYVTVPNVSTRSLKISAASEEPSVTVEDGLFTIEPTQSCGEGSPTSSAFSKMVPGLLSLGLAGSRGLGSALFLSYLFSQMMGMAHGETTEDNGACQPTVEIELSVPYDCPYNNYVDGQCLTAEAIADQLVQALFVEFDPVATEKLLADDYVQHNPGVPTGAAPVIGIVPILEESGLAIEVHRTLVAGNLVAYHSTYTNATVFGGETLIGFDVFRVEDGKVQEHWDNLQEEAGPNPSGNSMVDGPTMVKYLSETAANNETAVGLVEAVLVGGDAGAITQFISSESYTQHNPTIADGLDGLFAALTALNEAGTPFIYHQPELVVAEGNFVLVGSMGEFAGTDTAYYDLFRVENGLVVEHWDVIQDVPPASAFAHTNGKF